MKLSEIKQTLAEHGIRLTKSLGQNFLHDSNQLQRIVQAAALTAEDRVLEIGPGLGPLTERLLAAAEVLALEKDGRLVRVLQQRFAQARNLRLLCQDALAYTRHEAVDWSDWKMVSNLPYSVASPLLVELAGKAKPPRLMVATLQMEVARRLTAGPGDEDYGLLTLLVQLRYRPAGTFKIPATCFFPEPEVDSACVTLERRSTSLLTYDQATTFAAMVKLSFSQRRKMMLKLLKARWPQSVLEAAFAAAEIAGQARAETVSLEQFVTLAQLLHTARSHERRSI